MAVWTTRYQCIQVVSGCTTALYTVEIADNIDNGRTSRIHNCNQWNSPNAHTPCCQLPSVMLRVCSIRESGNWVASVALDLLSDRAYSFAHQDKSSWAAVSCPLAIERVQSQTELLRWLWLKKVGKFPRHDEANEYLQGSPLGPFPGCSFAQFTFQKLQ